MIITIAITAFSVDKRYLLVRLLPTSISVFSKASTLEEGRQIEFIIWEMSRFRIWNLPGTRASTPGLLGDMAIDTLVLSGLSLKARGLY